MASLLCGAALLTAPAAFAGALVGQVVDAGTGRPVASAVVIATGEALQGERSAHTDASGAFELPNLPPGAVTLDVQATGYQSSTRENVALHLDSMLFLRLELLPADATGAAMRGGAQLPAISAPSSATMAVVARDQTELIPYGRERQDFAEAASALPGVLVEPLGLRIPGAEPGQSRTWVDGVDVSGPALPRLAQRFIEELSVLRGVYAAEFGRATGAVIHAETRSGGNQFHGSVFGGVLPFELSRRHPGDALRSAGQGGFELGGPVQRDRLWFYGGFAPETVATAAGTVTDLQYVGKLSWKPAAGQSLSLSAFGDPGSGAGANDLSLRYFGDAAGVLLEGAGSWHHARAGGDRLEGALSAGTFAQLLGHHRLKAGADLASESLGSAQQTLFAAFAQDSWGVLDAVWLDAGVRYQEQRGAGDAGALLPRLGLSTDFTGRGLSRLYAAWGRFFQPATLGGAGSLVESAFSSGVQYQLYRDLVASLDYTHKRAFDGVVLSVGKHLSENYLLQISYALSSPSPSSIFKLDAAYAYEWTPKTTVSLGVALQAARSRLGLDLRAALRYALTEAYQIGLNADLLNALNHQADASEPPLSARFSAALSF